MDFSVTVHWLAEGGEDCFEVEVLLLGHGLVICTQTRCFSAFRFCSATMPFALDRGPTDSLSMAKNWGITAAGPSWMNPFPGCDGELANLQSPSSRGTGADH